MPIRDQFVGLRERWCHARGFCFRAIFYSL